MGSESNMGKWIVGGFILFCLMCGMAAAIGYMSGMRYMYYHHENYTDKKCDPCICEKALPGIGYNISLNNRAPDIKNDPTAPKENDSDY